MLRRPLFMAIALAVPHFAHAQVAQENAIELDPIVVRVRGISENSVAVPLSVQTMDGETLERRQFRAAEDSIRHTPGIEVVSGGAPSNSFMWVRGTGSLSHASLDDNSVGLRFDGASQGVFGLSRNLFDIEGIEIGKGPQGTLYGHNAEVGIINIQSRDPQDFFEADIEAGIGTNHLKNLKTAVNAPIGDTMAVRIAAMSEWKDDYVKNRYTGKPLNTQKDQGIRAKFLWQPTENTEALLTLHHDKRNNHLPLMLFPPFDNPPRFGLGNLAYNAEQKNSGIHLDIRHDFAAFRFDSQTRYNLYDGHTRTAAISRDSLPYQFAVRQVPQPLQAAASAFYNQSANNRQHQHDRVQQIEQEIRFSALPEAPVQWVGGIYLQERERRFDYDSLRNVLPLPAPAQPLNSDGFNAILKRSYKTSNQALFGEATWPIASDWKLITGARLSHENIRYQADWYPNPQSPLAVNGAQHDRQTVSDTALTGRIGLDYQITPDWHTYALYSRGHKSAGFSDYSTNIARGESDKPYHAGHIDAFEIGIKGEGERYTASAALFHNRVHNDKINVALYPSFLTQSFNVDTRSQGIEIAGQYRFTPSFSLHGNAAWTDAKVTKVADIDQSITRVGSRIPQVPRLAATIGGEYRKAIASLPNTEFIARADLSHIGKRADTSYTGKRRDNAYDKLTQPGYTLLDASLSLSNGKGEISLWGRNLTNRRYLRYAYLPEGLESAAGYPGEGRSYGIAFKYHFE